jgi:hypothetical protein
MTEQAAMLPAGNEKAYVPIQFEDGAAVIEA